MPQVSKRKEMIKVFSKAGCPQCDIAKAVLSQHGYTYEEVRIDKDEAAKDFVLSEGHRSVPQIYVGSTLLVEGGVTALRAMTTKQIANRIREINGN
jgi:glutaredoxin 3